MGRLHCSDLQTRRFYTLTVVTVPLPGSVGSASSEWYSAKQPVMLLGPLKQEVEKMLIRNYPDRYTYCTVCKSVNGYVSM